MKINIYENVEIISFTKINVYEIKEFYSIPHHCLFLTSSASFQTESPQTDASS